jgi:hypothetical protein
MSMAGLVWLHQSSALTACGRRIANLQSQRSELLERRSEALLAYARASAPDELEARARDLGFGPPSSITPLPMAEDPAMALDYPAFAIGGGPLGIVAGEELRDAARDAGILSRWTAGAAPALSAASADSGAEAQPDS